MVIFHERTRNTRVRLFYCKKRTRSDKIIIGGMTNTEGGVLYLGVEDNGDITDVHKKHKDPKGSPENVPMYPYEISGRLFGLSRLDYSAQILLSATMDDLDGNDFSDD